LQAFQHPYCRLAGPLGPAAGFPDLPGGSLLPRLLRGLRPTTWPWAGNEPAPPPDRLPGGVGGHGWFPRSSRNRLSRSVASYTPAASPRLRRRPSAWPPHRRTHPASELTPTIAGHGHALRTGPYPPGWSRLDSYEASPTGSLAFHLLVLLAE